MEPKFLIDDISRVLDSSKRKIKKSLKAHSTYKLCGNKIYLTHEDSVSFFDFINFKKKVISFHLIKGGVGKTTLAQSIAARTSLYGAKVLCIDLDQQSNLTQSFGMQDIKKPNIYEILSNDYDIKESIINVCEGVDLIKSALSNAKLDQFLFTESIDVSLLFGHLLDSIRDQYDYIIFDCPPTLGQSVKAAILYSDTVMLPVNPDLFSVEGLKICVDEVKKMVNSSNKTIDIKIIINKFDNRTILSNEITQYLFESEYFNELVMPTVINTSQEFSNHLSRGESIFDSSKQKKPTKEIDDIVIDLMDIRVCETKKI